MRLVLNTILYAILLSSVPIACTKDNRTRNNAKDYKVYALKHPSELYFAGEKVPIERWDIKESFDRELLVNTYWQSQMLLIIKRANKYLPFISKIIIEEKVPEDIKYIAIIESALRPTAVSPSKAKGMWQFKEDTAKEYGLEINDEVDERYHIEKSTRAACKYLKKTYEKFGNWTLATASYNAGKRGISKQLEKQKVENYYDLLLNTETSRYIFRILAVKTILNNPKDYGFIFTKDDLYKYPETQTIVIKDSIANWASWAKHHNTNYKILKLMNPWLRKSYLKNKEKKQYKILLPIK